MQVNAGYFSTTARGDASPIWGFPRTLKQALKVYVKNVPIDATAFVCVVSIDSPVNVQLSAIKSVVCENEAIIFKCSSHGNPAVDGYALFENDTLVYDVSTSGVWKRKMLSWGMFVYQCMAKNAIGTGNSTGLVVNVNCK